MRILITNTGPWGTGSGTVVNGVVSELKQRGHQVKVIFPDLGLQSKDKEYYYSQNDTFDIISFPFDYQGLHYPTFPLIIKDPNPRNISDAWSYKEMSTEHFNKFQSYLKERFASIIASFKPDIIETQHIWLMGSILADFDIPYVVQAHNSDQIGFHYDERIRPFATKCAQHACAIFALSEELKKEICELYHVPKSEVFVIPNGYDKEIFRKRFVDKSLLLKEYQIHSDPQLDIVTFAGKLSRTKGIDILLKANAIVQEFHPYNLIVFGNGDLREALEREATDAELQNVHFLGHVTQNELANFHNVAKFSVIPSRKEGFCVAALEAMGCQIPIVATPTGCMEKFGVGKIVPIEDFHHLSEAMSALLTMPQSNYQNLCNQAYQTALKYSWHQIVDKRLQIYAECQEKRKGIMGI